MRAIFFFLLFVVNPLSLVLVRGLVLENSTESESKEPETPLPTDKTSFDHTTGMEPSQTEPKEPDTPLPTEKANFDQTTEKESSHSEPKEPQAPLPTQKANFDQTTEKEPSRSDTKWIDIGTNTVYYIERTERVTWYRAEHVCRTMGLRYSGKEGRLPSFKSASELNLLHPYIKDLQANLWIGLSRDSTGSFKWTDNSIPTYTNWRKGEPNNQDNEDCAVMVSDNLLWNDVTCKYSTLFICAADKDPKERGKPLPTQEASFVQATEKEPSSSESETPEAPLPTQIASLEQTTKKEPPPSAPRWIDIGTNSVYYIEGKAEVTWFQAAWTCALMGMERTEQEGRLANLESMSDLLRLQKHLKNVVSPLWFGLSKRDVRSFVWANEKPTAYTNWDVFQPDNYEGKEDCVEIRPSRMKWNDQDCSIKRLFICASDKVELPDCGPKLKGWKLYNGNCYLVRSRHEDALDWMSAEQYCVNRNAHLVSMMDQKEDTFVLHQLLAKPMSLHSFWLGLNLLGNNSIPTWTDGSSINYVRTEISSVSEECVSFNLLLGQWKSIPCSRKMGIICKAPFAILNSSSDFINNCTGTAQTTTEVENRSDVATGGLMAVVIVEIVLSLLMLTILLYFLIKRWKVHNTLSAWMQDKVHIRWKKNMNDSVVNNSLI